MNIDMEYKGILYFETCSLLLQQQFQMSHGRYFGGQEKMGQVFKNILLILTAVKYNENNMLQN